MQWVLKYLVPTRGVIVCACVQVLYLVGEGFVGRNAI